jgi:hypothetical protein
MRLGRIHIVFLSIIPSNCGERLKLEELTVMVSAVVGVAGDEDCARWLAEVKNTMNCAVAKLLRRVSGGFSGGLRHGGRRARGWRFVER